MFKQRLLTSLVLVPLVFLLIYYSTGWMFSSLIFLVMMACGYEWLQLIPVRRPLAKVAFIILLPLIACLSHYGSNLWLDIGLLVWALLLLAVIFFPHSQRVWGYRAVVTFTGLLLLTLFATSMINIYSLRNGRDLIVYLFLLVWAMDIGAYLFGKQWGRHKLIPDVSPGKTVEGAGGGFLLCALVALGGYFYFQPNTPVNWFFIAFATGFISILGDLFISMLKRRSKIKDTGCLLPGHGGVLDRLDSLIAAAPLFYWSLWFFHG